MAKTRTMHLIRGLAGRDAVIYNDKLADGRRSIKVCRWGETDYNNAKRMLEFLGMIVTKKIHRGYSSRGGCHYTQIRLHVAE